MCVFFLPASGGILLNRLLFLYRAMRSSEHAPLWPGLVRWALGDWTEYECKSYTGENPCRYTWLHFISDPFRHFHGLHTTCCFCNIFFSLFIWTIFHPSPCPFLFCILPSASIFVIYLS